MQPAIDLLFWGFWREALCALGAWTLVGFPCAFLVARAIRNANERSDAP